MPTCINLKEQFGRQYRVAYEESYYAERGEGARVDDPWLMILPCRFGHIYPWDETSLAASVDGHPKIVGQLKRLGCTVHQDGDDGEATLLFKLADFERVAEVMHPHRRPQLTPEQRAERDERIRAVGEASRFKRTEAPGHFTDDRSVSEGRLDTLVVPCLPNES